jgi:hypothetical protein
MRPWLLLLGVASLVGGLSAPGFAVGITIPPAPPYASVGTDIGSSGQGWIVSSLPDAGSLTHTGSLGRRGTVSWDLTDAWLTTTWIQNVEATARTSLYFSPDADVEYALSGIYSGSQLTSFGGGLNFLVGLVDVTTGTTLFDTRQVSFQTPNEIFVLGLQGGDAGNTLTGSLTGMLRAGHVYAFGATGQLLTSASGSANGYVTLLFVPEPHTALLVAAGLLALARRAPRG